MNEALEEFGRKLVEHVRDNAILDGEVLKNPGSRDPLRLKLNELDRKCVKGVLDLVIPDIIDNTLFCLLRAIDEGRIRLTYVPDDGEGIDLSADSYGELPGWLLGKEGWIGRHSKYPTSD